MTNPEYSIQCRIPHKTPWSTNDPDVYTTLKAASAEIARVRRAEPTNEDGDMLEYRIVDEGGWPV